MMNFGKATAILLTAVLILSFLPTAYAAGDSSRIPAGYPEDPAPSYALTPEMEGYNHEIQAGLIAWAMAREQAKQNGDASSQVLLPESWSGMQTIGDAKVVVFMMEFPDLKNNISSLTADKVRKDFFGRDNTEGYPYESLTNYYERSSYGKLHIDGGVYGWYTAKKDYGAYADTAEMLREVLAHYDQSVDYRQYDANGDGKIDNAYLLLPAMGPTIWEHAGICTDTGNTADGVRLNTYTSIHADEYAVMGVIAYTGLNLGSTSYGNCATEISGGMGSSDMMADGMGDHNAFTKMLFGWIDPVVITEGGGGDLSLRPVPESGDVVVVTKEKTWSVFSEYYIAEYITRDGNYDTDRFWLRFGSPGLGDYGVRILHVNAVLNQSGTGFLYANYYNRPSYPESMLLVTVKSDGLPNNGKGDSASYYREGDALTPDTFPGTETFTGAYTGISFTGFTLSEDAADFTLSFAAPGGPAPKLRTSSIQDGDTNVLEPFGTQLSFARAVYKGSNFQHITLRDAEGGTVPIGVNHHIGDTRQVWIGVLSDEISLKPLAAYTLELPAGALRSAAGVPNEAISISFTSANSITFPDAGKVNSFSGDGLFFEYELSRKVLTVPTDSAYRQYVIYLGANNYYAQAGNIIAVDYALDGTELGRKTIYTYLNETVQPYVPPDIRMWRTESGVLLVAFYYKTYDNNDYAEFFAFDAQDKLLWSDVREFVMYGTPGFVRDGDQLYVFYAGSQDWIDRYDANKGYAGRYTNNGSGCWFAANGKLVLVGGVTVLSTPVKHYLSVKTFDENFTQLSEVWIETAEPYDIFANTPGACGIDGMISLAGFSNIEHNDGNRIYASLLRFDPASENPTLTVKPLTVIDEGSDFCGFWPTKDGYMFITLQRGIDYLMSEYVYYAVLTSLDRYGEVVWSKNMGYVSDVFALLGSSPGDGYGEFNVTRLPTGAFLRTQHTIEFVDEDGCFIPHEGILNQISEPYTLITCSSSDGGSATASAIYPKGTQVTLNAVADEGFRFAGWYENDIKVSDAESYRFTANSDRVLTAEFAPPDSAPAPVISTQPGGRKVALGDTFVLSLTASVSHGILSYQWYEADTRTNSGGTPLPGATGARLSLTAEELGTKYYYCLVTNTLEGAALNPVASVASSAAAVIAVEYLPGDVNGDGSVTLVDAIWIAQYAAGWHSAIDSNAADVNCDGLVTLADAIWIAQYAAGWHS